MFGFDLRRPISAESLYESRPELATKIGAGVAATKVDKNGVVWNISGITSLQADAPTYAPPGQVFGNSIAEISEKIEAYADTHGPPDGAWNSLGAYVDKNLGVWMAPEDMWTGAMAACVVTGVIPGTCPVRYRSRSFSYGPGAGDVVYVEDPVLYQIKSKIDQYAATHKRPDYGLPGKNPVPAPPGGVVTPLPPVVVTPDAPAPAPAPTPAPAPAPAPGPVAAKPAGNSGLGGVALAVGGVGALAWYFG